MGSTICIAEFPSPAIASSCFTAHCDSPFSPQKKLLSAYQWLRAGESLLSTIYRAFSPLGVAASDHPSYLTEPASDGPLTHQSAGPQVTTLVTPVAKSARVICST